jgi:AraC-like DNA-binding protein
MRYDYFEPAPDLRRLVGSYYIMDIPQGGGDIVRVEIPHIRFLIGGESTLQHGADTVRYRSPAIIVCGPVLKAGMAVVSPGTLIVGVSLTPLGWQRLLGIPVNELASRKVSLDDLFPIAAASVRDRLLSARDDADLIGRVDDVFRSLSHRPERPVNEAFIHTASRWLLDPSSPGIDALAREVNISSRQLDRWCNRYFGASPKRLHRVYRALHVSNRLAWTGERDWQAVAGDLYYDQSHLIRDFRELIGCTPGEFIDGRSMMIRFDLMKRLAIPHPSGFSLIG